MSDFHGALTRLLQKETEFGEKNGCKPPTSVLAYKWPLALDVVKRGFRAGRQKKLLSLFTDYWGFLGSTVELTILGGTGYATMDPDNIEAVLSTRFEGTSLSFTVLRSHFSLQEIVLSHSNSRLPSWTPKSSHVGHDR